MKIMFSFDIDLTYKIGSIVNNVGRVLVKEKALMLWLKETDINSDIYDTYKDLYYSEEECKEKLYRKYS